MWEATHNATHNECVATHKSKPKQCENLLPCFAHTYTLSLYTHLLQLTSTLNTPQREAVLRLLASEIHINPAYHM